MRTVRRGLRGVVRGRFRSGVLLVLMTTSIGLALIMLNVDRAFAGRLAAIRAEVGTGIDVRPAGTFAGGSFGIPGEGIPPPAATFSEADIEKVRSLPGVEAVGRRLIADNWFSDHLKVGGGAPSIGGVEGDYQLPMTVQGTDTADPLELAEGGVGRIVVGRTWSEAEADGDVIVVGQGLAEANGLEVGSTVDLAGFRILDDRSEVDVAGTVMVVGIFASGSAMGDNMAFMPVDTIQRIFGLEDTVSEIEVTAASVDRVEPVAEAIREALGGDAVEVITGTARLEAVAAPLADARATSRIGSLAALGGSAVVIVFAGLMAARNRIKEMAILKTVGAANWHVVGQFGVETLVLSVAGGIAGAALTFPLARSVANGLFTSPEVVEGTVSGGLGFTMQPRGSDLLQDLGVAVSPVVFVYALGLAVALAVLASGAPAWFVARVKPAEVLRHE